MRGETNNGVAFALVAGLVTFWFSGNAALAGIVFFGYGLGAMIVELEKVINRRMNNLEETVRDAHNR